MPIKSNSIIWLARSALVALVLMLCARTYGYDYVEFDDPRMFYENPYIRELSFANLKWMFTDASYNNNFYTPLLWLFYALSGVCISFAPQPQHVINVLIHAANTILVFEVIRKLLTSTEKNASAISRIWIPCLAALFWAIHPLRAEAVGWISARVHTHAVFFALAATWSYLHLRGKNSADQLPFTHRFYWLAVALYGLSVLAFPTVIMLPAALALLDWYPLGTYGARKPLERLLRIARDLAPFILVALIPAIISIASNIQSIDPPVHAAKLTFLQHITAISYVYWRYISATLVPTALAPIYTTMFHIDLANPIFITSLIMIPAISLVTFLLRQRLPALWCGWLCYLLLMVPFVGMSGPPTYAPDRYSYFSAIIWSVLLALGANRLWNARQQAFRWASAAVAALILIACSSAFVIQLGIWRDSVTLFHVLIDRIGDHPHAAVPMWRMGLHYLLHDDLDNATLWANRAWEKQKHPTVEMGRLRILVRRCQLAQNAGANETTMVLAYTDLLEACMHVEFSENQQDVLPIIQATYSQLTALNKNHLTLTPDQRAHLNQVISQYENKSARIRNPSAPPATQGQ